MWCFGPWQFLCDVNTEEFEAADRLYSGSIDGSVHFLLLPEVHYELLGLVNME